jgi:hypothetical protein
MEHGKARISSDAVMAAAILLLGLLLVGTGQKLAGRWIQGLERSQSIHVEELLGISANAAGLLVVGWWFASFLAAIATAVLERLGLRKTARATAKFSPAFMRRLTVALVGLSLFALPIANASSSVVDPSWQPSNQSAAAPAPVPGDRSDALAPRHDSSPDPQWKPRTPVIEPGLLGSSPHRRTEPTSPMTAAVVVAAGDSLWTIAGTHLGPMATDLDIAMHWPKWYEANRSIIGADPGLLQPGQVLYPPAP